MISSRFSVTVPREAAWRKILSAEGGVIADGKGSVSLGDRVQVRLGDRTTAAVVDLAIPGRGLALRMPEDDAILFLEFEGGRESFHIGAWWSVHDAAKAERIKADAMRTLDRARDAVA
jgi:hypothetical protein